MSKNYFIPDEEFAERVKRTQRAMRPKEIDLLLAFSRESNGTSAIIRITGPASKLP